MYLARFAARDADFLTAAFQWPAPEGAIVPLAWSRQLLAETKWDLALRIVAHSTGADAVLLISGAAAAETQLRAQCDRLLSAGAPVGLTAAGSGADFDAIAGSTPPRQIRVNYAGYHHHGEPLACDFRLYTTFSSRLDGSPATYQVHLRAHCPTAETERRVRKYLAWLDLTEPFTERVRAMQQALAQRLRQRGWLASEFLASADTNSLESWKEGIRVHFNETTGRIGFPEPPVEEGNYEDWLVTGRHPACDAEFAANVPCEGATVFSPEESALLLATCFSPRQGSGPASESQRSRSDVFISYASSDFAHAAAVCRYLEERGLTCWIAPRDIERGILPYPEALQSGLAQSRAVVVLVSETANLSVHIPRELDLALERKLSIVPLRLQDVLPSGQLNYLLRTCQWLNAFGCEFRDALEQLFARIRQLPK